MSNASDEAPKLMSTKMCEECIIDNNSIIMRRKTLLKEFKQHGITQAILDEFEDIVTDSFGHMNEYIIALIALTATLAAGKLRKPKEEAEKIIIGILRYEQSIRRTLKKSAVLVPQSECFFHQAVALYQEEANISPSEMEALDQAVQKQKGKDGTTPGSMYG